MRVDCKNGQPVADVISKMAQIPVTENPARARAPASTSAPPVSALTRRGDCKCLATRLVRFMLSTAGRMSSRGRSWYRFLRFFLNISRSFQCTELSIYLELPTWDTPRIGICDILEILSWVAEYAKVTQTWSVGLSNCPMTNREREMG